MNIAAAMSRIHVGVVRTDLFTVAGGGLTPNLLRKATVVPSSRRALL
jgi:hypothetical protein